MPKNKMNVKEELTLKIIEMMKQGGTDWTMPFRSLNGSPKNASTGKAYRGVNALWLGLLGQSTVAGYGQWADMGWQVQKGSKAISITAPMIGKDKETGDKKMFGFRAAKVFSSDDVLNIKTGEAWKNPEVSTVDLTERLHGVDAFIKNTGFHTDFTNEGKACYTPALDKITMPHRELFEATKTSTATEAFYSTYLHECGHMTGHSSRLDRLGEKNKRGYAFEELIAELTALFMCNQLQISSEPREDHAQYLKGWLKALGDDMDYIFKAATEAQKACDLLNSLQVSEEVSEAA